MLHICDYIQRHGSPLNYDGSRGENFGKVKVKDNAKLTNKNKDTLNLDIGKRIAEEDIINQASVIYHNNNVHWHSDFCNDIDIAMNANRLQSNKVFTISAISSYLFFNKFRCADVVRT